MTRPLVLVTEGSAAAPLQWLRQYAEVVEQAPGSEAFPGVLAEAQGLVVRTYTQVSPALLDAAPCLRVVGRGGVGLENIDIPACRARSVEVVYTPEANTQAVVELVAGCMVRLVRPWHVNAPEMFVTPGSFKALRESAGEQLSDLTLGILGMGRVGRALARMAHRGFGMRIRYHDLLDVSAHVDVDAEPVSFEELVAGCDLLSLHVDARPANRGLIDAGTLERAGFRWLINTSRGLVVEPQGLVGALEAGRLAGLALDVYDPEPPPAGSAYAALVERWPDRVVLTPHMASRTWRAMENMSWVVRDVAAVLDGRAPRWPAP